MLGTGSASQADPVVRGAEASQGQVPVSSARVGGGRERAESKEAGARQGGAGAGRPGASEIRGEASLRKTTPEAGTSQARRR